MEGHQCASSAARIWSSNRLVTRPPAIPANTSSSSAGVRAPTAGRPFSTQSGRSRRPCLDRPRGTVCGHQKLPAGGHLGLPTDGHFVTHIGQFRAGRSSVPRTPTRRSGAHHHRLVARAGAVRWVRLARAPSFGRHVPSLPSVRRTNWARAGPVAQGGRVRCLGLASPRAKGRSPLSGPSRAPSLPGS